MATSAWSTEAWTDTQASPPTGEGLIFSDNINGYSNGESISNKTPPVSEGGAKWGSSNADGASTIDVQDGKLAVTYAPDIEWVEQRFTLGQQRDQIIMIEWDLGIPANYEHFPGTSGGAAQSNAKFIRLWQTDYNIDRAKVGGSLWWESGNQSGFQIDMNYGGGTGPVGNYYPAFITASDRGSTYRMKYVIVPPRGNGNGNVTVYKDGQQICYASVDNNDGSFVGYKYGYFLGWVNSPFEEYTTFTIDNVTMTLT